MSEKKAENVTQILNQLVDGDSSASSRLFALVYDELRALAGHYMRAERADHTLQPTALVHEAYLRLIDSNVSVSGGRQHFVAVAAQAMRRLLVDHARGRKAARRGGEDWSRITLDQAFALSEDRIIDVVALDDALKTLAGHNERHGRLAELRFFGGLELSEAAKVLGIGISTAKRDWTIARAWLARELKDNDS